MRYSLLHLALLNAMSPTLAYSHENEEHAHELMAIEVTETTNKPMLSQRELDIDYLNRSVAKDMKDIFKLDPSVDAGTGARNGQQIFMRGVEDLNLNVQIDGARQGANIFHHQSRMQIDPFLLKAVEIKPGPAAADAGPGALGGSVSFETVDAQDLLKPGQQIGARIGGQYESASDLKGGLLSAYGKLNENTGLLVYTRRNINNELRTGNGEKQPSTDGSHQNYLVKMSMLDVDGHSLRLSTQRSEDEGGPLRANRPWQLNNAVQGDDDQEVYDESQNIRYGYRPKGQDRFDLKFDLYNSVTGLKRFLDSGTTDWSSESYGGNLHNTSRFKTNKVQHALTYGIDYFHVTGRDKTEGRANDLTEHASNTGIYLQNRMSYEDIRISTGLRQDRYQAKYNNLYNNSGSEISPNISGEWDVLKGDTTFTLLAGYGQSARGSRLNQAGWIRKYSDDFVLGGDKGELKAEIAYQTEWGGRWHSKHVFHANDHAGVDVTFYRTRIKDYVITPGEGSASTDEIYNADGDINSRGFEVSGHWGLNNLLTNLSYSHNTFRDYENLPADTSGTSARVGSSVGDKMVWDTIWDVQANLSLGYTLTHVQKLTDVRAGRPEKPGYTVHSVQAQWQPNFAKDALHLTLAVENLFNKQYAEHTSVRQFDSEGAEVSNSEAGRNIRLGVDVFF